MSFWSSRKSENRLQQRLKAQALTHQLPISKTDLPLRYPGHRSILVALRSSGACALERLDISRRRLVQQILQSPPFVQTALNLRHKLFRHIDGNTMPIRPAVQNITLMLFAGLARRAILADAPATPQAQ
ncbi:hypothetical protein KIP88_40565 [Bradyrhizobium sp. SRL28]|nr:hypothetical protein [Bradyrhizobium sp. SRL28]MBT1516715.1 hypothetical protein [Bradyrhizobium sp. SRL28]